MKNFHACLLQEVTRIRRNSVTGDKQHSTRQIGSQNLYGAEHFGAAQTRHSNVEQDRVVFVQEYFPERFSAIVRDVDVVALGGQCAVEQHRD